jgi:hypothetical protein
VIGEEDTAPATNCTGDPTVEPAAGDVTVTPAKAAEVEARVRMVAHKKFLNCIYFLSTKDVKWCNPKLVCTRYP